MLPNSVLDGVLVQRESFLVRHQPKIRFTKLASERGLVLENEDMFSCKGLILPNSQERRASPNIEGPRVRWLPRSFVPSISVRQGLKSAMPPIVASSPSIPFVSANADGIAEEELLGSGVDLLASSIGNRDSSSKGEHRHVALVAHMPTPVDTLHHLSPGSHFGVNQGSNRHMYLCAMRFVGRIELLPPIQHSPLYCCIVFIAPKYVS